MGASDDFVFCGFTHPIKDHVKDIYDDAVKNVHCIAGLTVAVEAVPGLVVADIPNTLSRLLAAIGMGTNRTVGSQRKPPSTVSAEHIA